jgi:tetraacyldisaccharide 4'-kinase
MLERWFNRAWYGGVQWTWIFLPLMLLYWGMVVFRRRRFLKGGPRQVNVPVVVVGNITVGGTGKTPVICELARFLSANGKRVGVLSRGYGAQASHYPFRVTPDSNFADVGDEPLLMAQRGLHVLIDPVRSRAVLELARDVDVILCDDGMQHYALQRDIEICLLDNARLVGNGHLLPVGPLREPISRLKTVDFVWQNGGGQVDSFQLQPSAFVNLKTGQRIPPVDFCAGNLLAIAGIGNPQRFFNTLQGMGFTAECVDKPDHYMYTSQDFVVFQDRTVVMTEKDAVKCRAFATPNMWYLEVQAVIAQNLLADFLTRLNGVRHG